MTAERRHARALTSLGLVHSRLHGQLVFLQLIEACLRAQRLRTNLSGALTKDDALLPVDLLQVMFLGLIGESSARHLSKSKFEELRNQI